MKLSKNFAYAFTFMAVIACHDMQEKTGDWHDLKPNVTLKNQKL